MWEERTVVCSWRCSDRLEEWKGEEGMQVATDIYLVGCKEQPPMKGLTS